MDSAFIEDDKFCLCVNYIFFINRRGRRGRRVREERDRYLIKERFIIDLLYLLRAKKGGF
jgi:hypothetical protein